MMYTTLHQFCAETRHAWWTERQSKCVSVCFQGKRTQMKTTIHILQMLEQQLDWPACSAHQPPADYEESQTTGTLVSCWSLVSSISSSQKKKCDVTQICSYCSTMLVYFKFNKQTQVWLVEVLNALYVWVLEIRLFNGWRSYPCTADCHMLQEIHIYPHMTYLLLFTGPTLNCDEQWKRHTVGASSLSGLLIHTAHVSYLCLKTMCRSAINLTVLLHSYTVGSAGDS